VVFYNQNAGDDIMSAFDGVYQWNSNTAMLGISKTKEKHNSFDSQNTCPYYAHQQKHPESSDGVPLLTNDQIMAQKSKQGIKCYF
jgi:hypothetical protein